MRIYYTQCSEGRGFAVLARKKKEKIMSCDPFDCCSAVQNHTDPLVDLLSSVLCPPFLHTPLMIIGGLFAFFFLLILLPTVFLPLQLAGHKTVPGEGLAVGLVLLLAGTLCAYVLVVFVLPFLLIRATSRRFTKWKNTRSQSKPIPEQERTRHYEPTPPTH